MPQDRPTPDTCRPRLAQWAAPGALLSGLLLSLAFPPADWSWLAWVALVPLGGVLLSERMTRPMWAGAYLGGLVFHLVGLDWVRTSYEATGFGGPYLVGWLIAGQMAALLFSLMVWLGWQFVHRTRLPLCLALLVVWVSFEWFRHYIAALIGTGAGWLNLSLTQAEWTHFAQVADLGGQYTVSLLIAAVNGLLLDLIFLWVGGRSADTNRWRLAAMACVPLVLLGALVYGHWRLGQEPEGPGPVVCLMGRMDLPPLLLSERLAGRQPVIATEEGEPARPDLLVWSELAYHHKLLTPTAAGGEPAYHELPEDVQLLAGGAGAGYGPAVRGYLAEAARSTRAGLLIGCQRIELSGRQARRYNCLAFADPLQGFAGWFDKCHLVPWTECTPLELGRLGLAAQQNFGRGQRADPLTLETAAGDRRYRFGCAVCNDVAFADGFLRQMRSGPLDFFVHCGSERRDETGSMSLTLLRMAQLRAIECRRAVVRNAHHGYSGLIDGSGRLLYSTPRGTIGEPLLLGAVPLDHRASLYVRWGDWLPLTALLLLGAGLLSPVVRRWARRAKSSAA